MIFYHQSTVLLCHRFITGKTPSYLEWKFSNCAAYGGLHKNHGLGYVTTSPEYTSIEHQH